MPRRLALGLALGALALGTGADAQSAARGVEAVVVPGSKIPAWSRAAAVVTCQPYPSGTTGGRDAHNGVQTVPPDVRTGVPVDQVAAFRWEGLGWLEIPVQVDQRFFYCLSNPPSDFAFYSGTDKELTYAWDVESWKKTAGTCSAEYPAGDGPTPDPVATLDDDDEIVFMARDAGAQAPALAPPPLGASNGQALAIVDPLAPGTPTFVYLFQTPGGGRRSRRRTATRRTPATRTPTSGSTASASRATIPRSSASATRATARTSPAPSAGRPPRPATRPIPTARRVPPTTGSSGTASP